tara:strand:+ start:658 stop:1080 length:423 start_codon:yes stop_codon:yes gene_type:complete
MNLVVVMRIVVSLNVALMEIVVNVFRGSDRACIVLIAMATTERMATGRFLFVVFREPASGVLANMSSVMIKMIVSLDYVAIMECVEHVVHVALKMIFQGTLCVKTMLVSYLVEIVQEVCGMKELDVTMNHAAEHHLAVEI